MAFALRRTPMREPTTEEEARAERGLTADLLRLGVRPGQDLLVHCSLRRVGPIPGGAATLFRALRTAMGQDATLVVPAQTTYTALSSNAFREATTDLDPAQFARYVAAMPAFDQQTSPCRGMGAFAEHVRTTPGSARSAHPTASFAALGPRAAECMAWHETDCHLGERSPLAWLYRTDAAVLLLGVGYGACTALHLAEYRLPEPPAPREYRCLVSRHGVREEYMFTDIQLYAGDFEKLGEHIDREPFVRRGQVGSAADCRLLPVRNAVDFAMAWPPFRCHRAVP
jgi:aminoglycoside 3-N-acetyltransferase